MKAVIRLGLFMSYLMTSSTLLAAERVALVLGVSSYKAPVTTLKRSKNDARDVANLLKGKGYKVIVADDVLTKKHLIDKLSEFEVYVKSASLRGKVDAVVYYSGHGLEARKNSWMITADFNLRAATRDAAKKELERSAYTVEQLFARFQTLKLNSVTFILDACRYAAADFSGIGEVNVGFDVASSQNPDRSFVIYSASREKPSYVEFPGDGGKNSVFTHFLLKRLSEENWELNTLLNVLQDDVLAATNNRVPSQIPAGWDGIPGRFYLFGTGGETITQSGGPIVPIFYKTSRIDDAREIATAMENSGVLHGMSADDFSQLKHKPPVGTVRIMRSTVFTPEDATAFEKTYAILKQKFGDKNVKIIEINPNSILYKPFHVQLH